MSSLKKIDRGLIERYGKEAFMYVEYPHKRFWDRRPSDGDYRLELKKLLSNAPEHPMMLYVHIPFCHKQCLFCTCHVDITLDYSRVTKYLDYLHKEIDFLAEFFSTHGFSPNFHGVHLGGGSPTYPKELEFDRLVKRLSTIVDIASLDEFAIEIDPRRVKPHQMKYYRDHGINRVSFGIQDFDLRVQKAVDRVQPSKLIERLLTPAIRDMFPNGVNFDIICGLPKQTQETFLSTMSEVVRMLPDRVCVNYMHMSSHFHPHQLRMPADAIPDRFTRKEMFTVAAKILLANGYVRTGYDHFVRHSDPVAIALQNGYMGWNRLGVTTGRYDSTIGIGVSSTSTVGDRFYCQNYYDISDYMSAIDRGEFPIELSYSLSDEDLLRRSVIQRLRNYFSVEKAEVETEFGIDFDVHFHREIIALSDYVTNGLVLIEDDRITINEIGWQFANLIASIFDIYIALPKEPETNKESLFVLI